LARRRDASHNRLLNQNSNLDLNGNNQRAPPYGKGRAAPTPVNEAKQPGLTSRKS